MRRAIRFFVVLLGLFLLAGCLGDEPSAIGPAEAETEDAPQLASSINVFNWGEFIDPAVLGIFRQETGINVIYSMYASNEEMYQRIRAGGADFDVLFPSDYMIERMINQGMLAQLNWENIPNAEHIDDRFWYMPFDPDNQYSVPYMWGTFGIMYNTTMVNEPVYSWDILWNPAFANQIFMYDASRDTMGAALRRLGFSLNTTDINEINAARDSLITQRPLVRAFLGDQIKDLMINRDGALGTVFSGDAVWARQDNPELNFIVPVEGTQIFLDSMVIPSTSIRQYEAEMFINFMTRPDIAYMNTRYVMYSTTNATTFEMLPDYMRDCEIYWPPYEVFYRLEAFADLGDFKEQFERAWTEVLAAN
ncbi:MAG: ABC transporter substrate-binding protein [Defluviitaleaceae bacterium]|nr:ABC transporter substrate-binding protein [Defluviitaleaceae bacterium]